MGDFFNFILNNLKTFNPITDTLDILLVTYVIYVAIQFLKQTRAAPLIKGLALLAGVTVLANLLKMNVTSFIIRSLLEFGVLVLVIIFQPELRAVLERMGRGNIGRLGALFTPENERRDAQRREEAKSIVEAAMDMSRTRTGALIVIEGRTHLGDIAKSGTELDALISSDLIKNVFYPKSPLHDGALILREGRMFAAGCVLPLTQNISLSRELGTRHRAALGLSEVADCLVVVVSEETGKVSTAQNGVMVRDLDADTLFNAICTHTIPEEHAPRTFKDKVRALFGRKGAKK